MTAIESRNPANGEVLESFEASSDSDVDRVVGQAHDAFGAWRRRSYAERASLLHAAAELLRKGATSFARTMALEMGKPIGEGKAEAEKCATTCDYYANNAERLLAPEPHETDATKSFVRFDPLGVVFAVMPWNFPFWQVFRFAAPALMAGNGAVLKHAPNVTRCALQIEQIFEDAGFPSGLFGVVHGGPEVASRAIAHPNVVAVTLTGSERAGGSVAEQAGRALKKAVLELGGSDPFIVLADADLAKAAQVAAAARLLNSGQSCIAAKRFIVVDEVADRFVELFVSEVKKRKMGDPLEADVQLGPQARLDLRENLHRQVTESLARGAKALCGGELPGGKGAFYPATVLEAPKGTPVFDEETFGPVAAVTRVKNEDDAIRFANDTPYGLGASLWTADRARAEKLAAEIDAGCVFVNGLVKSDPRIPFGGIKRSGYGRELSVYGLREFTNVKTVWIA
jgi:succinate-semialdehyde dehydrogenase / glutarate-semialdehyde dehydrogenase